MSKWVLAVNVAGVKPMEPGFPKIPTGAYACVVKDTNQKASSTPGNPPNIEVEGVITEEGEAKGIPIRMFLGTDLTKDGNKKSWRSFLLGVGASPAILDQQTLNLSDELLVGKTFYIYNKQAPEGAKRDDGKPAYDDRTFIAPDYYAQKKQEAAQQAQGGTSLGTPTGLPANGAAPGGGLGALAASLGGAPQPGATPGGGGATFGR